MHGDYIGNMKNIGRIALISLPIIFLLLGSVNSATPPTKRYVGNLDSTRLGKIPHPWRTWPFQRGDAGKVYKVREEKGKRIIRAYDDHDSSTQMFLNFIWPIKERPMLSWRWKATTLPAGAAENNDKSNDSACGVYVVVGKYSGHAIKYVWSTTLKPGTVVSRRDDKLKIKVIDSGPKKLNEWINHEVDVVADYKTLFGKELEKNPSGIGILTDGNAVHKPAGCDYADFAIDIK